MNSERHWIEWWISPDCRRRFWSKKNSFPLPAIESRTFNPQLYHHEATTPWRPWKWVCCVNTKIYNHFLSRNFVMRFHGHTQAHHAQDDSSGRVIIPNQRPVPDNTQHLQETDSLASDGVRTPIPSMWPSAEPRLTPRGHWDRRVMRQAGHIGDCFFILEVS
jgi:hypothetical protein